MQRPVSEVAPYAMYQSLAVTAWANRPPSCGDAAVVLAARVVHGHVLAVRVRQPHGRRPCPAAVDGAIHVRIGVLLAADVLVASERDRVGAPSRPKAARGVPRELAEVGLESLL